MAPAQGVFMSPYPRLFCQDAYVINIYSYEFKYFKPL